MHIHVIWFYVWNFISHCIKEMLYVNTYSNGNKRWNKNKETFSLVSDVDAEKDFFLTET